MPFTIFLTGATGFVGRATLCRLAEAGHELRALTRDPARLSAGPIPVVGTMEDIGSWAASLAGVDAVIHLAARVHVMQERAADPLAAFRALNATATLEAAEAAARAGVRRFVFVSTIKVNGEATVGTPFTAEDPPAPVDPYGISKWEAEQGLRAIAARTGLEVVVIRPPLVHGPGVGGNLRRLLSLVDRGIPLPLGAIENRRRMVGVRNLADLIATTLTHPAAPGRTFLAGDAEAVSTPELIHLLADALGRSVRSIPFPVALLRLGGAILGQRAEVDRLTGSLEVDITQTCTTLGWTPPVSLAAGLREMARAWKETR